MEVLLLAKPERTAFEAAKEIVIAKMTNTTIPPCEDSGKNVGEFFQEIYDKLLEIAKSVEN